MSEFVQIVRMHTEADLDTMTKLNEGYRAATAGRSTYTAEIFGRDLDTGDYVIIVTFPSREAADANNALPETAASAEQMAALASEPLSFANIEVIERRP